MKSSYLTLLCRTPSSSLLRTNGSRFEMTISEELGFVFVCVGDSGVPSNIVGVGVGVGAILIRQKFLFFRENELKMFSDDLCVSFLVGNRSWFKQSVWFLLEDDKSENNKKRRSVDVSIVRKIISFKVIVIVIVIFISIVKLLSKQL